LGRIIPEEKLVKDMTELLSPLVAPYAADVRKGYVRAFGALTVPMVDALADWELRDLFDHVLEEVKKKIRTPTA
jgi:hypothetical protein